MTPRTIIFVLSGVVGVIVLLNSLFVVQETNQAMVLSLGKVDRVIAQPGLKFRIPFYQQVVMFDKRILATSFEPEEVVTADKKRIVIDSFTRWRVRDAKTFYEAMRSEQTARQRLNFIVNSSIREKIAAVTLQDMTTPLRDDVMASILSETNAQANRLGVEIIDVRIKRTDLPDANAQSVFNRMRAERDKEAKEIRAKGAEEAQKIRATADKDRTILIADAQKEANTLRGQGDAEAGKIYARAYGQDPAFYSFLRTLEAYRNALANPDKMLLLDPSMDFLKTLKSGN